MKKPFICHLHNGISSFSSRHFKQFKNSEDLKIVACNFKMQQGTCGFHKLIPSWIFFRFWSLAHLGHDSSRKHEMWKQALQSKKKKIQGTRQLSFHEMQEWPYTACIIEFSSYTDC